MKILLTGSSGAIGTRLFETLLKHNYEVVGDDIRQNKWNFRINRPGEVLRFEADITMAKNLLGYKPKVDIEPGLNKTVRWYSQLFKIS